MAFIMCVGMATAGQAQQLTLNDAVTRALRAQPSLELAAANTDRARAGVREAKSALLPSLGVDASLNRFEKPMVVAPLHGFDIRNPPIFDRTISQGNASLSYTLFDATRGSRISRLTELEAAAESNERSARMQTLSDAVRAYVRVATTRDVLQAQNQRVAALQAEYNRAKQLVEQGRAARVVGLRAQAALSAAQADVVSAAGDVESAENDLARLLTTSSDSIHAFQLPSPQVRQAAIPDVQSLRQAAHSNSPDLQRAQRQVAAAEASRREARGLYLPHLQLAGSYSEYASPASHGDAEWQTGAAFSYPIFTGGSRAAATDRATADIRAAHAEYELAARRVDEAIDRALAALHTAHARTEALQATVSQSEEVTRIDRLALEQGAGVQTDYLTSEAELLRARAALSDARALELVARVELARVTGLLNERWITENVQ